MGIENKQDQKTLVEFPGADDDTSLLTVNILRTWPREKIVRFAKHLLGDHCQECDHS